jgi:predicted DNA-binding protein (MmcQ/YjbR family)
MSPLLAKVRDKALSYPDTTEEFPWGDRVAKVKGKVFIFMGQATESAFSCSLKLPRSHAVALELPFAEPTGYGLGKSGWVTFKGPELQKAPFEMLEEWLDESFRAVAPAAVLKKLDTDTKTPEKKAAPKKARTARKR